MDACSCVDNSPKEEIRTELRSAAIELAHFKAIAKLGPLSDWQLQRCESLTATVERLKDQFEALVKEMDQSLEVCHV